MPSPSEDAGEMEQTNANSCAYQGVPNLESLVVDGSRDVAAGSPVSGEETKEAPLSGEDPGESPEEEDDVEEEDEDEEDTEGEAKGEYPSFVQLPQDISHSTAQCDTPEEVTHTSNGHYVPNVPQPAPLHHQHQHHQLTAGAHSRGALYPSESPPQVHSLMLGGAIHHGANGAYVIAPTAESEYQNLHHPSHLHHHQQHHHHHNQVFMTGNSTSNNCNKEKMKPKRKRVISCEQRKAANIRERRRMTSLNEAFDILRKAVPTFHYEKKLSRIETLKLAIQYIYFMTEVLKGKDPMHVSMTPRLPMFQGMMSNMIDPGRPGRRGRRRKDQNHILMHHTYPFLA